MLDKFKQTIKAYRLISKGEKVLVAVSGGADSLALLFLFGKIKREMRLALHVAHFNHHLRKDCGKDAGFVKKLAEKLKLPVSIGDADLKQLRKKGSLEELCRRQRLDFLIRLAKRIKASRIALGHNLDDQAETVLMRLIRGAGLSGLSAISPLRRISGACFIRPLIEVRRKEIERYLKRMHIRPRVDVTNSQDIFLRNRLRHRLLPLLEKEYNAKIKESLAKLAQCVSADYQWLEEYAGRQLRGYGRRLPLAGLRKLHRAVLRMKIRSAILKTQGSTRRISFRHIMEVEDLLFNRPSGSIVNLPKGLKVSKSKGFISFSRS